MNVFEWCGVGPFAFDIINLKLDVWRYPVVVSQLFPYLIGTDVHGGLDGAEIIAQYLSKSSVSHTSILGDLEWSGELQKSNIPARTDTDRLSKGKLSHRSESLWNTLQDLPISMHQMPVPVPISRMLCGFGPIGAICDLSSQIKVII